MRFKGKFVLAVTVVFLLIGCGKAEAEPEKTAELTQEDVKRNEEVREIEQKDEELAVERNVAEEQEETSSEMRIDSEKEELVDWEKFALQANNEDFCLAMSF